LQLLAEAFVVAVFASVGSRLLSAEFSFGAFLLFQTFSA
jgi:hypothetical protein